MKLGTNDIGSVYLGTNAVQKVYLGTNEVWTSNSGLLADYPNAAAAYSLRLLQTAYTGSAIRVRRASDNTEQDIGFVNNVLDTASLTTFCSGTNGFVTTWYDQSGGSNDATQSTAANQPQIVSSGSVITENGKPTLDFRNNAVLDLQTQLYSGQSAFSYYFTTRCDAPSFTSNTNVLFSLSDQSQTIGNLFRINIEPLNLFIRVGGFQEYTYTTSATDYSLFSFNSDDGSSLSKVDGFQNGVQMSALGNQALNIDVGVTQIGSWQSGYYDGNIQEAILYISDQNSNRTGIETNINTYYSIY